MATRPRQRGPQEIKQGIVTGWPPDFDPHDLAERATYGADGKHKNYPSPNGEWDYRFRAEGATCPKIAPENWPRLLSALREAIRAGVVLHDESRSDFPARAWIYIGDQLCEARLSNAQSGEYHGFPLDPQQHFPRDPLGLLRLAPRLDL